VHHELFRDEKEVPGQSMAKFLWLASVP